MNSKKQWTYDDYEILNVVPCEGLQAVYAVEDDRHHGKYKLTAFPIHFIGVARRTIRFMESVGDPSDMRVAEYAEPEAENVVVGLELGDGWFQPCNEADNFAGLCHEGDDISQVTGMLVKDRYPLSGEGE